MADTETTTDPATTDPGEDVNLVTIRGTVVAHPSSRTLPGGTERHSVELRCGDTTVPVVGEHPTLAAVREGDRILVLGSVRRRFFRAGGVTQSRTEVVAESVVKATS